MNFKHENEGRGFVAKSVVLRFTSFLFQMFEQEMVQASKMTNTRYGDNPFLLVDLFQFSYFLDFIHAYYLSFNKVAPVQYIAPSVVAAV